MKAAKDKKGRILTPSKDLLEYLRANNLNKNTDAELSERYQMMDPLPLISSPNILGFPQTEASGVNPTPPTPVPEPNPRDSSLGPEGASKTQKSLKSLDLSKVAGPEGIPKRDPNYKPPVRDVSPAEQPAAKPPTQPVAQPTPQPQNLDPPKPVLQPRASATILPTPVQEASRPSQSSGQQTPQQRPGQQTPPQLSLPTEQSAQQQRTVASGPGNTSRPAQSANKSSAAELRKKQLEADVRRMKVMEELVKKRAASQDSARSPSPGSVQRREQLEKQRQASLKEQVKKYKEKKEAEQKMIAERERQRLLDEENRRRARSKAAMAERRTSLERRMQLEKEEAAKRSVELKERAEKEAQKALKVKQAIEAEFGAEREKMIREQRANEKITNIFNSGPIKDMFRLHEPQLKYVFKHYVDLIRDPSAVNSKLQDQQGILHLRNFMAFMNQFGLVPAVLNLQEAKLIYRSATRRKTLDKDAPVGLDYKAFSEILLRISIKKANLFSAPLDQMPKSTVTDSDQNGSIVDEVMDFSSVKQQEDVYEEVEQFKNDNLDFLFKFLDLPTDKPQLADKLNSLRQGNLKTAEQRARILEVKRKFGIDRRRAPSATAQRDQSKSKLLQGESVLSENEGSPPKKPPAALEPQPPAKDPPKPAKEPKEKTKDGSKDNKDSGKEGSNDSEDKGKKKPKDSKTKRKSEEGESKDSKSKLKKQDSKKSAADPDDDEDNDDDDEN